MKLKLTAERVRSAKLPMAVAGSGRTTETTIADTETPGLCLRVYSSGKRVFMVRYRVGTGRDAMARRHTIGNADKVSLGSRRSLRSLPTAAMRS